MNCYSLETGDAPLLISIPHDGRDLVPGMAERMTAEGLQLPDTDWYVRELYEFAKGFGAGIIAANYSRYVVDLNRSSGDALLYTGQLSTGLCPAQTFSGDNIYQQGQGCDAVEQKQRVKQYWQPYHDGIASQLLEIRERFGYALLWDAHSIRSEVPRLFDGQLPELNIGTNSGTSCDPGLERGIIAVAQASGYSTVINARFKGGFITRNHGNPMHGIHAIQLELAQRCYMDESTGQYKSELAGALTATLRAMLQEFMAGAARYLRDKRQ